MIGGRDSHASPRSPRPTAAIVVTAVAVVLWSACPGIEAVSDTLLKIACEDMTPRHPGYEPENLQNVPCPYRLLVDTVPVRPGDLVNLTLVSVDDSMPFKGFMIQARDADDHALGTFLPDCSRSGTKPQHMISCLSGNEPYVSNFPPSHAPQHDGSLNEPHVPRPTSLLPFLHLPSKTNHPIPKY